MWIFTTTGYLSVVESQNDNTALIVRARVKGDLEAFVEKYVSGPNARITFHLHNDYPFRLTIAKADFARAIASAVMDIDYETFKVAVAERQGMDRARIYTGIWGRLWGLESNPKRIANYLNGRDGPFASTHNNESMANSGN
jgi:hypothetical protein